MKVSSIRNPLAFNEARHRADLEAEAFELSAPLHQCGCPVCKTLAHGGDEFLRVCVESRLRARRERHTNTVMFTAFVVVWAILAVAGAIL